MENKFTELDYLEILIKDLAFQDNGQKTKIELGYNMENKGFQGSCFWHGERIYSDIMPTVTGAAISLWWNVTQAKRNLKQK